MIPIQDLFNRIRWDKEFGAGRFTIGYLDRLAHRLVTVPFERIDIEPGNHFSFAATLPDGEVHEVPFHRVREVHRDDKLIWQRKLAGERTFGQSNEKREP
ncbi:MAG TPA: DUF504 domain-containing protein [Burkholderiaceae bacterium]|nr:DUF504 domain-containing protein [Burkholderiaceae bacterium]